MKVIEEIRAALAAGKRVDADVRWYDDGDETDALYKIFGVHPEGLEAKRYSGLETFIPFADIEFISIDEIRE